ncbi:hypothetical protein CLTEP_23630 [Clostridium tepidiprofundi DSM 19306]|uniref:DUF4097 domain-containing protein n=1 Tax=Clostridium tepidiprofundi DSM 19306 TaxID=1121338 RepID=A0A151AVK6_9CLOT|nr:DUF4097 family beta strand repeat-containing protein [Clostridium tepidiprofundi]KYH31580.1 hypothetical protein CLTEP_23630 [Clostridium tepidiprofundi DSM 19306]
MKKKFIYCFMAALVMFTLIFTGCGVDVVELDNNKTKDLKEYSIDEEKNEKISGLNKLFINACSDINIIPEDREDIKAHLHGDITCNFEPKLIMDLANDSIKIKLTEKTDNITIRKSNLKLDIYIPKTYSDSININNISGRISVKNLKLNDFHINTVSGNTSIQNLTAEDFYYNAVSGDLDGKNVFTNAVKFTSVSGNIKLDKFKGNIKGKSVSGKIVLNYETFNNDINIKSTSGDINITLPHTSEFYLDAEVISGKINCDFPIKIESSEKKGKKIKGTVRSNKNSIRIEGVSGNINININTK